MRALPTMANGKCACTKSWNESFRQLSHWPLQKRGTTANAKDFEGPVDWKMKFDVCCHGSQQKHPQLPDQKSKENFQRMQKLLCMQRVCTRKQLIKNVEANSEKDFQACICANDMGRDDAKRLCVSCTKDTPKRWTGEKAWELEMKCVQPTLEGTQCRLSEMIARDCIHEQCGNVSENSKINVCKLCAENLTDPALTGKRPLSLSLNENCNG